MIDYQSLLTWALGIVGSGGIGAAITYFVTLKSKLKLAEADAESAELKNQASRSDLQHDLYDYLLRRCDKYIKDYHELEGDFRKLIAELREQMDKIMLEKSQAISAKCNEIAELKSKVTYLKGIRCYNFTCLLRIKNNPDKTLEEDL